MNSLDWQPFLQLFDTYDNQIKLCNYFRYFQYLGRRTAVWIFIISSCPFSFVLLIFFLCAVSWASNSSVDELMVNIDHLYQIISVWSAYFLTLIPPSFHFAASVLWCWSWEKEGRAVEVVPGIYTVHWKFRFPCAQLPGPVHTARLGRVCLI